METVFGFTGKDFVCICADKTNVSQIFKLSEEYKPN